jgi:hypothetical protein
MKSNRAIADDGTATDLLTVAQVAAMTPFKESTFRKWRLSWPNGERRGPKPTRVEGRVFYRRHDFESWLSGEAKAETP